MRCLEYFFSSGERADVELIFDGYVLNADEFDVRSLAPGLVLAAFHYALLVARGAIRDHDVKVEVDLTSEIRSNR